MASIDKTYLRYDEYLVLKEWCENTELIYDNGVKGSPSDFLYSYIEPYEGEMPVWNTPYPFDEWLYYNCPLSFIQQRLIEQYSEYGMLVDRKDFLRGTKYTKINSTFYKDDGVWYIDVYPPNCSMYYGWDSHKWYPDTWLMPPETKCVNHCVVHGLSKRKLNRLIKNWQLPIGTEVTIYSRRLGVEYKTKIK